MNKLYIFILSFFLISCDSMQTIVEVEIPPHEPVLVLNGKLDTDTIVHVMLSHSVGAFDEETPNCIIDAEVLLYKDNVLLDTLIIDLENADYVYYWSNTGEDSLLMYYYKSNYIPTGGHLYKIIASHSDYNTIEASTFIPNNLEIMNLNIDTNSSELVQFNFSFIDDPSNRNYYELELYANCSKVWDEEEYDYSGNVTIFSNDPSFPGGIPFSGYSYSGDIVLFTDVLFNGEEKNISFDVYTDEFSFADCDTVLLEFSNFSNETYSYYNSLGSHRDKGGLGIFGGEVVPVYTNVNNGLGALVSVNSQSKFLSK